ncbi:MAG: hypothetical protein JRE23_16075, partial [Deltaproteobacteria bacterium]|nr:hypothetical protein [Deltaproteobacteria bacterium]
MYKADLRGDQRDLTGVVRRNLKEIERNIARIEATQTSAAVALNNTQISVNPVPNYKWIDFIPQSLVPAWKEGRVFYDEEKYTLTIYNDIENTSMQVGLETWVRCRNRTGVTIVNGAVVYVDGATGQVPTLGLFLDGAQSPSDVLGLVTADIENQAFGWCTVLGEVNDIDTDSLIEGAPFYASTTTPGEFTASHSETGRHTQLGICLYKHSMHGKALVRPADHTNYALQEGLDLSGELTGWVNNAGIVLTYDPVARTITLTGDLRYLWRGEMMELTSPWVSDAHDTPLDHGYFLFSVDGKAWTWQADIAWEFKDLQASYVYFGTTDKFALREPHATMDWEAHQEFHETYGTYRKSGGLLTSGTYVIQPNSPVDADNTPGVDQTLLKDEDILTTVLALLEGTYTWMWGDDSNQVNWSLGNPTIADYITYPLYNLNGVLTDMGNNGFMNVYVVGMPVTSDVGSQSYRFMFVPGSQRYSSLSLALLEAPELNIGNFTAIAPEFNIMLRITLGSKSSYNSATGKFRIEDVVQIAGSRAQPTTVGGTGSTDHNVLSNRTIADQHPIAAVTGLQAALDGKLGSTATAADSAKLGGQLPEYYATASSLGSYLPLAGGTLTGALAGTSFEGTSFNSLDTDLNGSPGYSYESNRNGEAVGYQARNINTGSSASIRIWSAVLDHGSGPVTVSTGTILKDGNGSYLEVRLKNSA